MMKYMIIESQKLKKFSDEKPRKEKLWEGSTSRVNLIGVRPGQEIRPHIHDGDHIWVVIEGEGVFLSSEEETRAVAEGTIIIVPSGGEHGIRNTSGGNLVFASITA